MNQIYWKLNLIGYNKQKKIIYLEFEFVMFDEGGGMLNNSWENIYELAVNE